ncbi:MAG: hypothetical protein KDA41_13325, partial [Planctomycetales bacterium]|nr:hypothetical protein [Planctomycetales bacterium]
ALEKIDGYVSQMAEMDGGADAAKYKKFRADIGPLLARLDSANRDQLIPALADGQSAIVLDAKITSTQWASMMPESTTPLPMLELGMVMSVSDPEKLKAGCAEYMAVAREMLAKLAEIAPDDVPAADFPEPKSREFGDSTVWYYLLPKDWGIDKRIAPNAGVSPSVAALSLAPLHTKRLLEKTPLAADGPIARYRDKPLAMAGSFNFAGLVDAVTPWIEYSMTAGGEFGVQADADGLGGGPGAMEMIEIGAKVLKCFRGYSSVTYVDGDVMVTEGEWRFEDLQ